MKAIVIVKGEKYKICKTCKKLRKLENYTGNKATCKICVRSTKKCQS